MAYPSQYRAAEALVEGARADFPLPRRAGAPPRRAALVRRDPRRRARVPTRCRGAAAPRRGPLVTRRMIHRPTRQENPPC